MVPRFAKPGKSFKGVMLYLMHDPDHAASSERVAWTHTLNLAHDDVSAALAEMQSTALNAGVLKAEHGVGGRKIERPVKHFSLNWHPSERPDQAEMLEAVQSFLKHMGWDQHQAVVIAHSDKEYHHAHVVLNAIHPETGLKLDDSFERRRAQQWALAYEQTRGQDFCPQRGKTAAEREEAEPRPAWMDIKEHSQRAAEAERTTAFDPSYMAREENRRVIERHEWQILKELQKQERLAFFDEGKDIYRELNRSIYREVREEFRNEWASYYAAKREGLDPDALRELRTDLITRQQDVLHERRDDVTAEKRAERDLEYRDLLDAQKIERGELIDRQELGLRSPHLLARAYAAGFEDELGPADRLSPSLDDALDRFGVARGRSEPAPDETGAPRAPQLDEPLVPAPFGNHEAGPSRDIGTGLAGGILAALGALGDSLVGGHSKPPKKAQLERFGIQRGQPPPGDAGIRAERERQQEWEDWHAWKGWHHLDERER